MLGLLANIDVEDLSEGVEFTGRGYDEIAG